MHRGLETFPRPQCHGFHTHRQSIVHSELIEILGPIHNAPFIGGVDVQHRFDLPRTGVAVMVIAAQQIRSGIHLGGIGRIRQFDVNGVLLGATGIGFVICTGHFTLQVPVHLAHGGVVEVHAVTE